MSYPSITAAVIAKYGTLTAANFPDASRPAIWLDEAPQQAGGANTQQRVPYVIIEDLGDTAQWTFSDSLSIPGQNAVVKGAFALTVYYQSDDSVSGLTKCGTAMNAILWNGAVPDSRAGVAFMVPDLTSPLKGISVIPTKSQQHYVGASFQNKPVYSLRQEFKTMSAVGGQGF